MSKSSDIRELISVLSQSEKRYFRIFSKLSGTKDTVTQRLFNALIQNNYKQELDGIETSNLSRDMGYLEKQLLRALRHYHDQSSAEIIVNQLLCEVELLYNKRLYAKCLKWIGGGLRVSQKEGLIYHTLLLLKWKQRCHHQSQQNSLAQEVNQQEQKLLLSLQNAFAIKTIFHELFDITLQDGTQSQKMKRAAKRISNHPVLAVPDSELSFDARLMRLGILQFSEIALNGYTKHLLKLSKRSVNHFDRYRISQHPNQYFAALARLSTSFVNVDDVEGFERTMEKMQEMLRLKNLPKRLMIDMPTEIMSQRLQLYAMLNDYTKGIAVTQEYSSFVERNAATIRPSSLATYYLFSAVNYYYNNHNSEIAKCLLRSEKLVSKSFMLAIFIAGRLLEMMLLVDEAYYIPLPYKVQSLERALKEVKHNNSSLNLFIRFLKSVPKFSKPERKKQTLVLTEKLNSLTSKELDAAIEMVNGKRWLNALN